MLPKLELERWQLWTHVLLAKGRQTSVSAELSDAYAHLAFSESGQSYPRSPDNSHNCMLRPQLQEKVSHLRRLDQEQENQEKTQKSQWHIPGMRCGRKQVWLRFTPLQPKAVSEGEKLLKPDRLGFKSHMPSLTSNASLMVALPQHPSL